MERSCLCVEVHRASVSGPEWPSPHESASGMKGVGLPKRGSKEEVKNEDVKLEDKDAIANKGDVDEGHKDEVKGVHEKDEKDEKDTKDEKVSHKKNKGDEDEEDWKALDQNNEAEMRAAAVRWRRKSMARCFYPKCKGYVPTPDWLPEHYRWDKEGLEIVRQQLADRESQTPDRFRFDRTWHEQRRQRIIEDAERAYARSRIEKDVNLKRVGWLAQFW